MHRCVPDFEVEDDDPLPSYTAHVRRKSSSSFDEEPLEISWQRGPVVQPVQGDRTRWRSPPGLPSAAYGEIPDRMEPVTGGGVGFSAAAAADLFMEEDEMVAWLHHQINEEQDDGRGNLYEQLLGSSQGAGCSVRATPEREAAPLPAAPRRQGTVVAWRDSRASETLTSGKAVEAESRSVVLRTCEQGVASSSDVSVERAVREDRKRKAKEAEDPGCHSEDANFERGKKGKDVCRSASARRTRAADVHNLSERRRRDRINEKMKALQGLIPRCNKSDKASMLDEAIEYVKSLQLQVQMMSMGCNPMIFPGMQAYLPPMGMGMNMGMGTWIPMGTEVSAGEQGRPIFPFGPALPGPPTPGHSPVHLAVRPFMPLLHPPSMTIPNQFRVLASNQQDAAPNSVSMQGSMVMQLQNVVDPHHLYTSPHGLQTLPRSQPMAGEGNGKEIDNTEKSKC